jgi:hypothetical protein
MRYTDKAAFIASLHSGKIAGVILWQGASLIDGTPIVAVASKFDLGSDNEKTGAMVQTFILPCPKSNGIEVNGNKPAKIMAWLKATGAKSICGDCVHAWQWDEATQSFVKGSCYVREYQAPAATLGAIARGSYPVAGVDFPFEWLPDLSRGLMVRLGSYGDPCAAPVGVWEAFTAHVSGRTGYTHMWKSKHALARANALAMASLVMASCDSESDKQEATRLGFRCFVVIPRGLTPLNKASLPVGSIVSGAMLCPASKEFKEITGKLTSCARCGACSGLLGKGKDMPNVFIPAHGATANRVKERI